MCAGLSVIYWLIATCPQGIDLRDQYVSQTEGTNVSLELGTCRARAREASESWQLTRKGTSRHVWSEGQHSVVGFCRAVGVRKKMGRTGVCGGKEITRG